jgi:hypothetical protein
MPVLHCDKCRNPIDQPDSNGIVLSIKDNSGVYHNECWGLPSRATEGAWRSIETAPRDGTTVILGNANGNIVLARNWGGASWMTTYGNRAPICTHWQPLPAPPATPPHKDG